MDNIVFNYIEHTQFLIFYIDQLIALIMNYEIENAYTLVPSQTLQRIQWQDIFTTSQRFVDLYLQKLTITANKS